jgi:tRNA (cytidine/uridine-2'-O-)-methyltransferase
VDSLHVVLVEPEIHWNTGNAGRTCLAAGARLHLVEPLGFSLDDREVRRAGLDYWPRVQPRVWPSWEALERRLPELGEPFFFSAEAPRGLWSVRYPERLVLVFGRESAGLPLGLRKRYQDRLLAIPMIDPALRSLNLSSAVAVVLYEVLRQREAAAPAVTAGAAGSPGSLGSEAAVRDREAELGRAGERKAGAAGDAAAD